MPAHIVGIDARADVVDRATTRATELGWSELEFIQGPIDQAESDVYGRLGIGPEIVVALHACDTATDDAILLAIRARARAILVAPCCQSELARQLDSEATKVLSPALGNHGLLRRQLAATWTDALRVEALQMLGYSVDVLEFVDGHETAKNLLIRAVWTGSRRQYRSLDALRVRLEALGLRWHLLDRYEQLRIRAPHEDGVG